MVVGGVGFALDKRTKNALMLSRSTARLENRVFAYLAVDLLNSDGWPRSLLCVVAGASVVPAFLG